MSPEQARGRAVDRRADIWAFGVVMLEMLTARRVFDGETVSDTLASVIKTEPDWDSLPENTPRPIVRLLKRCLDKDPRKRLRDIGEARVVIDQVLRGELVDEAAASTERAPARGPVPIVVTAVLVAIIAGAAAWFMKPGPPEPPLRKFSLVVTSEEGESPLHPEISPDGSMVAYVLEGRLLVQELDQLEPRELVAGSVSFPFWSPDSKFLGYIAEGSLWKVPVTGGNVVKICDPGPGFTSGAGAAWNEDGRIVYVHGSSPLFEVSANGGDPRVALELAENEADFHEPSLLPDGKGVIFVTHRKSASPDRIEIQAGERRIPVVHVEGVRLAAPAYSPSGHILFHRSGTNSGVWAVPFSLSDLAVSGEPFPVNTDASWPSVSGDGTLVCLRGLAGQIVNIAWIDRDGTIGEPLSDPRPNYFDPALSPDGTHLAICEWDGTEVDIWIHDLQRRTRTRFTFAEGPQSGAEWTPDGSEIIYHDTRGDTIRAHSADGTGTSRFIVNGRRPSLSSDGKYLAFHTQEGTTQEDLWYIDLAGGGKPVSLVATPARELLARVSPNGQYVAYESDESGDFEIYITRFPGADGKWQVSTNGGSRPRWSRDGSSLFYQENNCDIMEVSVDYQPALTLGTPTVFADCSQLGLYEGFGREYEVDLTGNRILHSKSAATEKGRIDIGITVVENWAKEFGE
jgi:serine/threonine-protein kinase